MPFFGEYETVGEPHAITPARDHVSTVWRARKSGALEGRVYGLKSIAARRSRVEGAVTEEAQLGTDRGLEFIGAIKQVKQALSEGGRGLAPIHDFGTSSEGVWFVTDFCERFSLKALVTRQAQVDDAALRHVVHSVVTGCLALGRACGRSHGNLKLSNVLRGGRSQPLRTTPLLLVDPMPVPSARISRLDRGDRQSVEQTMHNVFEAQDLKAIGELVLQLVEGRVIESGFDYNYPVAGSVAWERLGKAGERWRGLCNQLLDPQLSLERVNLAWLDQQFQPKSTGRFLAVCGGAVLVASLAGGGFYALRLNADRDFHRHLAAAQQARQTGDALAAAREIGLALQRRPESDPARAEQKNIQALLQSQISLSLAAGQQAEKLRHWSEAKSAFAQAARLAGSSANPQPALPAVQAEQAYAESMEAAGAALAGQHWDAAMDAAKRALDLRRGADEAAQALLVQAREMSRHASQEQAQKLAADYQSALEAGQKAFQEADYNLAIQQAHAALGNKPGDATAMQLANDAMSRISALAAQKQEQDYQAALVAGQQAFQQANYNLAMEKANAALALKPDRAEARKLAAEAKAELDATLTRQQQDQAYQSALAEAAQALKQQNYGLALEKANTALGFKPDGAEARQLAAEAKRQQAAVLAKQQQEQVYQTALADGRKAFTEGNYNLAVEKAYAALGLKSDSAEAKQLAADAKARQAALLAQQQQEQAYQAALADGRKAFTDGNYKSAVEKANAALGLKPDSAEAKQLAADAKAQQAALAAKQQLEQDYQTALADGRKAFTDGDYNLAVEKANAALGLKSDSAEAKQLVADARAQQAALVAKQQQEQAYQSALADGRQAFADGNYTSAAEKANAALGLKPDSAEAKQLAADAKAQQAALLAKQQQEQAYQTALADGRKALTAANYPLALDKANVALGLKPDSAEAKQLAADARQQQDLLQARQREQAYQTALADGTAALKASNYPLAMDQAHAALGLKPGDAAATTLLSAATQASTAATYRAQFADDLAKAKGLKVVDPLQALAVLKEARDLQSKNAEVIPPDPTLDTLATEINDLQKLDRQLEDLMKRYHVQPKDQVRAINPKNSSRKEYSSTEMSDNYLTDLDNLKKLQAAYKKEWLNQERNADFTLLENKLNLF